MVTPTSPNDRHRILVVDADALVRSTFVRVLGARFAVTTMSDGSAAIDILAAQPFDAVVTDLDLPTISGDQIVAWLQSHNPKLVGHVLIFTGGTSDTDRTKWLDAFDPLRVVRKPCSIKQVESVLMTILGSK